MAIEGEDLVQVMAGFRDLCDLPSVWGANDYTPIHIQKPHGGFASNYSSYKSKDDSMQLQVVVNHEKHSLEVFIGMLGWLKSPLTI